MGQPYIGEIRMFAGNFAPTGWAYCWGQPIPISENETLFQVIGTTYGGDGQEYFALPDLRGRVPVHRPQNGFPGEMGGVESVTLTTSQIPAHAHSLVATTALANKGTPGNARPAQAPTVQLYAEDVPAVDMAAQALSSVGGGQPHDNMHPYLALNFIISLYGVYPSQT